MRIQPHSVLADVADDGDVPRFGEGDGEAGGAGAGANEGNFHLPCFVEHFAGDSAATEQN